MLALRASADSQVFLWLPRNNDKGLDHPMGIGCQEGNGQSAWGEKRVGTGVGTLPR